MLPLTRGCIRITIEIWSCSTELSALCIYPLASWYAVGMVARQTQNVWWLRSHLSQNIILSSSWAIPHRMHALKSEHCHGHDLITSISVVSSKHEGRAEFSHDLQWTRSSDTLSLLASFDSLQILQFAFDLPRLNTFIRTTAGGCPSTSLSDDDELLDEQ